MIKSLKNYKCKLVNDRLEVYEKNSNHRVAIYVQSGETWELAFEDF